MDWPALNYCKSLANMQVQQRTARMLALLNVLKLHGDNLLVLTLFLLFQRNNAEQLWWKIFCPPFKRKGGLGFLTMLACLMAPEAMPIHSLGLGKDTGFSAAILTAHNSAEWARAKAIPIATIANPPTMPSYFVHSTQSFQGPFPRQNFRTKVPPKKHLSNVPSGIIE